MTFDSMPALANLSKDELVTQLEWFADQCDIQQREKSFGGQALRAIVSMLRECHTDVNLDDEVKEIRERACQRFSEHAIKLTAIQSDLSQLKFNDVMADIDQLIEDIEEDASGEFENI